MFLKGGRFLMGWPLSASGCEGLSSRSVLGGHLGSKDLPLDALAPSSKGLIERPCGIGGSR